MKTIQEALRALKEDQNEVINPSAPTRCETYVYKVKPEQDYLLVGSLVQRIKNEYLNLGFNMSTVYVGFRSMSDTGKAICFLRLSDAREFCNKYNISIDEIYLGRDFNEYVRITKDDDIPAYMQRNGILRCKYQNPQITSNLEAELEDNNSYADTDIIEKNNLRARTKNLYQSGTEKMREISPRLQWEYNYTTQLGNIVVKYDWEHARGFNSKLNFNYTITFPTNSKYVISWKEFILVKLPESVSNYQVINSLESYLRNKYQFKNFRLYIQRGAGRVYSVEIQVADSFKAAFSLDLKNHPNLEDSIRNKINKTNEEIKNDMSICSLIKEEVEKFITEMSDPEPVEITFDNFDQL